MRKAVPKQSTPVGKTLFKSVVGKGLWKRQFILRISQLIRSNIISRYESK